MADNDIVASLNEDIEENLQDGDYQYLQVGSRDWTAETIISQVLQGNIDLNPRFQRRNAWNDAKRSRFIESLILGVPIPQLLLAQQRGKENRGKFIVIDGKQRLLTLAGLRNERYDFWSTPRQFQKLNEIKDLNGVLVDKFLGDDEFEPLRRQLENASIRCAIVSGYRGEEVLYDLFYRVNSGSVPLSGQELRQVFYTGPFSEFLFDVTTTEQPIHNVLDSEIPDPRFVDIEVILRALANELMFEPYAGNLKRFLDSTLDTGNKEWPRRGRQIEETYALFNSAIARGTQIFGAANNVGRKFDKNFRGRFNKAVFEVQAYYFARLPEESITPASSAAFCEAFAALCQSQDFASSIESTTKSLDRFATRFQLFRLLLNDCFGQEITDAPELSR